jgi:hypothetical protein
MAGAEGGGVRPQYYDGAGAPSMMVGFRQHHGGASI